jgi:hypothetical protein
MKGVSFEKNKIMGWLCFSDDVLFADGYRIIFPGPRKGGVEAGTAQADVRRHTAKYPQP